MKIKKNTIKKFLGISASALLVLSIGGGIINSTSHNIHADAFDDFIKQVSNRRPTKSDIADEQEQYDNSLKDSIRHPKNIHDDELVLQDNYLFYYNSRYHKRNFKQAIKQGIRLRKRSSNNVSIDNIAKNAIGRGPYMAIDKDQYDGALNDVVKYPKDMSIEESILQGNPLFHKKSFEKAVRQGIHKRAPRIKQNHRARQQPKRQQVKAIRNSLKRINLKINRVAHHKYRTKRTKRNAKRYLNRLRNECKKYKKQLNSINRKQYTKRHIRRHRNRSYKHLRK